MIYSEIQIVQGLIDCLLKEGTLLSYLVLGLTVAFANTGTVPTTHVEVKVPSVIPDIR